MFRGEVSLRLALIVREFPSGRTLIHGSTSQDEYCRSASHNSCKAIKTTTQQQGGIAIVNTSCGVWETSEAWVDGIHESSMTPATGPG